LATNGEKIALSCTVFQLFDTE